MFSRSEAMEFLKFTGFNLPISYFSIDSMVSELPSRQLNSPFPICSLTIRLLPSWEDFSSVILVRFGA